MVVRIKTGKSIRRALSYNERKLASGMAELLLASGFPVNEGLLGYSAKMKRFQSLLDRNPKIKHNAVHISLNFPPEEKLTNEKMIAIANEYMERIGFADQPFLVYRHKDAKHPHFHIVSTNLKRFGRPISLHRLVETMSEPARKDLEQQFGLITAESRPRQHWKMSDLAPWPANYGKEETKHAISNILSKVLSSYKFENFEEYNAILGQFRITAYRGVPNGRMFRAGGLIYQLLDRDGHRVGIPIKASSIDEKVMLKNLERPFSVGRLRKIAIRQKVEKSIRWCLSRKDSSGQLATVLEAQEIGLVLNRSVDGYVQNAFFVDHRRKAIFSAAELNIDVDKILEKIVLEPKVEVGREKDKQANKKPDTYSPQIAIPAATLSFLQGLLSSQGENPGAPEDDERKKKKRRKGPTL